MHGGGQARKACPTRKCVIIFAMSTAVVKIVWWQVLFVIGGTLLVSFLVLLIPSIIARRIQPIKAIRFS